MKTRSRLVLMIVALIGLSKTASFATNYYVDPSSTATTAPHIQCRWASNSS